MEQTPVFSTSYLKVKQSLPKSPFLKGRICVILAIGLFFAFPKAKAQDKIQTYTGTTITCKIVKETPFAVTFRVWGDTTSMTESIRRKEIQVISRSNVPEPVQMKNFQDKDTTVTSRSVYEKENEYGPHILSLIPLQGGVRPRWIFMDGSTPERLVRNHYGLSYEHVFKNGKIGLRGAVFGGPDPGFLGGGLEFKWYPTGQGMVRYYLGPAVQGAWAEVRYSQNNVIKQLDHTQNGFWISPLFTNGISLQPNLRLNLTAFGSIGPAYLQDAEGSYTFINFQGGLSLGYRFW